MAIVFPTSPSNNDTFTVGSITYTYDGSKWIGLGVTPTDRLIEGSNSLEINASNELVWTGGDAKFGGSLEVGANIDLTDSTVDLYSQTTNAASKTFQLFSDIGGTKTEKVSITANGSASFSGQVIAGTTFNIANVSGSIAGSGGGQDYIGLRHGATFGLMLKTAGTNVGNVGIGEDSPVDRLVVQKTNASGDVGVRIKNDTLTDGDSTNPTTASLYLNTSTGDFNTFYIQARRNDGATHFGYSNPRDANHTPNLVITSGGDVGIKSTTSPRTELDLFDGQLSFSHRTDYSIRFYNGTGNNWSAIHNPSVNDGTNASALSFKVATGESLRIDTAGEVTKPRQPSFIVRYSVNETTWNVATDGWTKIPFDEEMMDKGGNFSTANSEFTAPVTGAYLFGAELQLEAPNGISSGYLTSGSNWMYITFIVNGSTSLVESKGGVRADANFNAMYNAYNPTHLLNLTAGDTVCMYRTGNYSSIKFKGGGESVFWGYLVA